MTRDVVFIENPVHNKAVLITVNVRRYLDGGRYAVLSSEQENWVRENLCGVDGCGCLGTKGGGGKGWKLRFGNVIQEEK
jgi:hypothetical protein